MLPLSRKGGRDKQRSDHAALPIHVGFDVAERFAAGRPVKGNVDHVGIFPLISNDIFARLQHKVAELDRN